MTTDEIIAEVIALEQPRQRQNGELPTRQCQPDSQKFDMACEELCERLRISGGTAAFDALFALACYEFEPQFDPRFQPSSVLAGHILFYVRPICTVSCQDAVRAVSLSQWNVSLEEVPWYLAAHFGPEAVCTAIAVVESEPYIVEIRRQRELWRQEIQRRYGSRAGLIEHPGDASVLLETVRYWLDKYVEDAHNRLRGWTPLWQNHRPWNEKKGPST